MIFPDSRDILGNVLGGAFSDKDNGSDDVKQKCRRWSDDPYFKTVAGILRMSPSAYTLSFKNAVTDARRSRDERWDAAYKKMFSTEVTNEPMSAKVPAALCSTIPLESLAYSLTVVEGCFPRAVKKAAFDKFSVPSLGSACPMEVVGPRMWRDSNGDDKGGATPKGIMVESKYDKKFWIIFRATDDDANWYTVDFKLWQTKWTINGKYVGKVHVGFHNALEGLDRDFGFSKYAAEYHKRGYSINISGLSMGGALSTAAAVKIAAVVPGAVINVVTFGSPRVGDDDFVNFYNSHVRVSQRVVAVGRCSGKEVADLVTTVPPKDGQTMDDSRAAMLGVRSRVGDRWLDEAKAKAKAALRRAGGAVLDTAKDGLMTSVAKIFHYKHVKGFYPLRTTLPYSCPDKINVNKFAAALHGTYRGLTDVVLGKWLDSKVVAA